MQLGNWNESCGNYAGLSFGHFFQKKLRGYEMLHFHAMDSQIYIYTDFVVMYKLYNYILL